MLDQIDIEIKMTKGEHNTTVIKFIFIPTNQFVTVEWDGKKSLSNIRCEGFKLLEDKVKEK